MADRNPDVRQRENGISGSTQQGYDDGGRTEGRRERGDLEVKGGMGYASPGSGREPGRYYTAARARRAEARGEDRSADHGFEGWGTDFARNYGGERFEHGRAGFRDYGVPMDTQGREIRERYDDRRDFRGRDDRYAGRSGTSFRPEKMETPPRNWRPPEEEWEELHYHGRPEHRRSRIWEREPHEAQDIMTRSPKSVNGNATLREVAQIMRDENCGIVPVVDDASRLVGLVTDRDMVMRTYETERHWNQVRAHEVMSRDLHAVTPDESIHDVIKMMSKHQVRRVPVVDQFDRLVGMISMADVANRAHEDEELQHALDRISKRRSFWTRMWS